MVLSRVFKQPAFTVLMLTSLAIDLLLTPAASGEGTVGPSPPGTVRPSPPGTVRPSPTGTVRPSPLGTVRPSPPGTVRPSPPGTVRPLPTGTVRPSPPGTVRPSPPGTVRPSPPGTVRPSPTGTVRPSPSGTVRPSPPGTVRPSPPGTVRPPMVIKAYPNTLPVPLGTTVVLECRISGDSSTVNYQWSCPNGACDISSESRVTPRSRIVNGNTLTVNVVSESDGGEYRCTVTEGGNTQTSSYNITVSGGVVLYKQESRTPLAVYPNGSVVTSENEVSSGFYHVAVKCVGGNLAPGTWSGPDGSDISTNSFAHVAQDKGELLVSNLETGYSNGNYKCRVGENEAVIGLYLTSGSHIGTYSRRITNFQANQTSSGASTARLSWDQLTLPRSVTTVGYFVSYGRVDHGVRENVIVEGRSTTSVDLRDLHTGVEYEATIRGFSEDGTVRRVSTPVTVKWTMEKCPIKGQRYFSGEPDDCAPCLATCKTLGSDVPCAPVCASGCACPNGKVLKKGRKCVKPRKCRRGCVEGGNKYKHGQAWDCSDGCNRCRCANGRVVSTKRACPPGTRSDPNPPAA